MAGRQPRQMPGGETLDSGAPHSLLCRAGVRPCRAALLRQHDSESGFAIGAILFLLTMIGVGGAVLYSGYSQILRTNISITRENAARNDLIAASRTLSASAALINGGLNLQPPAVLPFASADTAKLPTNYANSGTTGSPTTVGVMQAGAGTTQLDPWGHYYVYCRWENATSPGTDPGILLITAGPDGVLDTKCGDLTAQNDDKIQILSVAQAIDRANVWQYQTTTGGSEVQFGITSNAVRVTNSGDISANSLTLAGALNAGSLALSAPLAVNQGGTGSSTAAGARSNLGSGAVGDALFTAATAAGGRGTLGSTTVGDALFTAATATAARSTLGATAVGDSVFTAADAIAARAALGAQAVGDSLFQQDNADDALSVLGGTDVGKDIFTAVDAGAARTRLGATAVGSSVFTAASGAAARAAIGAGATGDAVFVAANQTQALTALGLLGGSLTLDVGITGTANTAVYLADGANILAGAVPIAHGGTGATTAATARSNLGMDNATNLTSGTLSWSRLPTSGVSAGSYNWGTVNSQGIVTAANNVNIIPNTVQGTAGGGSAGAVTVIGGSGFGYDNDGGDVNITGGEGGGGYVAGSVNITGGQDSMGTNGSINLTAYPAGAINLKGNTYVRPVTGTGSSSLNLWGNSDYDRFLNFTTTGTNRWALGADSTAESGGNAGSNFVIRNYDDAGALLGTPFSVDRATGNVTINGTVTATTFIGASGGAGAIALGTSATGTNPSRSGELGTGLYSAASGLVDIASVGNEVARFSSSGIDARAGVFLQAGVQALKLSATGNPVVGNTTMSIASAPLSVAVGRNALASVTSEANSVAVGHRALASATSATGNTAVGYQVLAATTTGSWNTAMGYQALASSTTAVSNSAFGYQALVNTLTGTANTAVGMSAAFSNIGGGGNTGVGYQSLYTSSTNFYNTAVGYQALYFANGNFNSAFGASALLNTTTGTDNVAVGRLALTANTVGQYNIAVGNSALSSATTAAGQVAVGYQALTNATTATGNTAVGYLALANTTTGSGNTALGYAALQLNTTGQNNIAVGQFALRNIWSAAENTGNSNIAIGSYSLGGITNETNNIAIGHNAAVYSYGSNMTVVGVSALGDSSNHLVSDGSTVVGATSWSSGAYNAILGAGVGAYSGASGSANSAVGYHALYNSTTGINNVALGYSAGSIITTGSDNLILGYSVASTTLATGTNNILLGTSSAVDTPAAGTSNWLNIGNTIYGDLSNHRIAFGNAISATTTGVTFDLGNVTDSMRLPLGTTVQRPTGAQGMLRYNSTTGAGVVEYYDGATWQNVASGSSAGSIALGVSATANNPARSGELGTGLFSAATGQVSVASNGVEVGRFDASGLQLTTATGAYQINGLNALRLTSTGNPIVGNTAMSSTLAPLSVAMGRDALANISAEVSSVAIGHHALNALTTGVQNAAVGYQTLRLNTTGFNNTAIGYNALPVNTSGSMNTAIGAGALFASTTGSNNIAVGNVSSYSLTTGVANTVVGDSALYTNTTGNYNNAFGARALQSTTTGTDNVAVGRLALNANTVGQYNVAVGNNALAAATTPSGQVAVGYQALTAATTATGNTAIGYQALLTTITATSDTAVGYQALRSNTTGYENSALGSSALLNNTTGYWNSAFGAGALLSNLGGASNSAFGRAALIYNTSGVSNSAVGRSSLYANTVGQGNSAFGDVAMVNSVTGSYNNAFGVSALGALTTGSNNTAIGYQVGNTTLATGSNNILIGTSSAVDTPAAATNYWINIGNTIYGSSHPNARQVAIGAGLTTMASGVTFDLGSNTDSMRLPLGTTAQRPTGAQGMFRYNTQTSGGVPEYFDGTAWQSLLSSGSGVTLTLGTTATANNPQRSGEAGTGLFSAATGQVSIASNGVETGRFDATGLQLTTATGAYTINGLNALRLTSSGNPILGSTSMSRTAAPLSIGIGRDALASVTSEQIAVAIGHLALAFATTATGNTAVGYGALASTTTGTSNTALGAITLTLNTTGVYNNAVGGAALFSNTIGSHNNAFGAAALVNNTIGVYNTAIGSQALNANSSGSGNIAIGTTALVSATTADGNTAVGFQTLLATTTGANNLALGYGVASTTLTTGSNNILIGTSSAVDTPAAGTSNWLNIGNMVYGDTSTKQLAIGSGIAALASGIVFDLGSNTNSMRLPIGTTAQRPSGAQGMLRYNTTTADTGVEYYDGSAWTKLATGSGSTLALGASATANNPQRSGDVTTGLFSAAAGTVSVAAAGTEMLRATATSLIVDGQTAISNRYIRTTDPNNLSLGGNNGVGLIVGYDNKVSVGDSAAQAESQLEILSGGFTDFRMNSGNVSKWTFATDYSTDLNLYLNRTAGTGNFVFSPGYNVGIGTATPAGILDVQGGTALAAPSGINLVAQTAVQSGGTAYNGGNVVVTAGDGYSSGDGGTVVLTAGRGNLSSGMAGYGSVLSLDGSTWGGSGGSASLTGGNANNGFSGGSVSLNGGVGSGSGAAGNVLLANSRGGVVIGGGSLTAGTALDMSAVTSSLRLPLGNTAQRPSGAQGMLRYNTTTADTGVEYYDGSAWQSLATSSSASSIVLGASATANNPARSGELGTGLFSAATGQVSVASNGVEIGRFDAGGLQLLNSTGSYKINGMDALKLLNSSSVLVGRSVTTPTGLNNTGLGALTLQSTTTGTGNTAVGARALILNTGSSNTAVGNGVGGTLTTGSSNILIGTSSAVDTPTSSTSNWLNIGDTVYGDTSTKQVAIGSGLTVMTTGVVFDLGSNSNSMRLPVGTTAQRPTGAQGMLRYNTTTADTGVEYYDGSAWTKLATSSGSTLVLGASATANNPQRSGEASTGLFSPATGEVAVSSLGSEAIRITATGSVGIGTATPSVQVHLAGTPDQELKVQSTGLGNHAIVTLEAGSGGRAYLRSTTPESSLYMGGSGTYALQVDTTHFGAAIGGTYASNPDAAPTNGLIVEGLVGIGNNAPSYVLDITSTGGMRLPVGTTAQRPTGAQGVMRYNSTTGQGVLEYYDGAAWQSVASGSGGSGSTLGSSLAAAAPARSGEANTGLYSTATGTVQIGGLGSEVAQFVGAASQVNYLQFSGAVTTAAPTITAGGTDTNINISLTPKGSGKLNLTTGSYLLAGNNALATPVSTSLVVGNSGGTAMTGTDNVAVGYLAMNATTTGIRNAAVGSGALMTNTWGGGNAAFGYSALGSNSSGGENVAVGSYAMTSNSTGYQNVALGSSAMEFTTTGTDNIAIGWRALRANTGGSTNIAIGSFSLLAATTATGNTAVGYNALTATTTGTSNTVLGYGAGDAVTTGSYNVAVGLDALGAATTSSGQVAIGYQSLLAASTSTGNTAIGYQSMKTITTAGHGNTALGYGTLALATSATGNTAIGLNAMAANTTGDANTVIGTDAYKTAQTASGTTAIGYQALSVAQNTATGNSAIGYQAAAALTTADESTAVGYRALAATTTGQWNTAVGNVALAANVGGSNNTAVGAGALALPSGQSNNTALGMGAGYSIQGSDNVVIGADAGSGSAGALGSLNVAVGSGAMRYSTGTGNVAIGAGAMSTDYEKSWNVAIGYRAGSALTTGGDNNVAIGADALRAASTATGNIAIGSDALISTTTGANNTVLGTSGLNVLTTGANNLALGFNVGSTTLATGTGNILIGTSNAVDTPAAGTSNWLNIGNTVYGDTSTKQIAIGSGLTAMTTGIVFDLGSNTNSMRLPKGNTAQRPTGAQGMLRYNTTTGTGTLEYHDGTTWQSLGAGGSGSSVLGSTVTGASPYVSGDTTSGLFSPAASAVAITTAGVERLRVDGSGNIGVGMDAPNGDSSGMYFHMHNPAVGGNVGPEIHMTNGNTGSGAGQGFSMELYGGDFWIGTSDSGHTLNFYTQDVPRMTVESNGDIDIWNNLGFGTAPTVSLDLSTRTDAVALPRGITAQRPTGAQGMLRYNTTTGTGTLEYHDGTTWQSLGAGGGGGDINGLSDALTDYATTFNMFLGSGSGGAITTGANNTALGFEALKATTTGVNNSALGSQALTANVTGSNNSAFGRSALISNTAGDENSAFGVNALYNNTTGGGNIGIGYYALASNTTGNANIAVGGHALQMNSGTNNVAVGNTALWQNTTGNNNTAVGDGASQQNTTGTNNVSMGTLAVGGNTTGQSNTGVGSNALQHTNGDSNSALGRDALYGLTSGSNNVGIGNAVGFNTLSTGSNNILIGTSFAVDTPTSSTSDWLNIGNTIYGDLANHRISLGNGVTTTTAGVTFDLGGVTDSMRLPKGNTAQRPTGAQGMLRYNTTTGAGTPEYYDGSAWQSLGAGGGGGDINGLSDAITDYATTYNMFLGSGSGAAITTGSENTAIGVNALGATTTGRWNVALGNVALTSNTVGSGNVALGREAMERAYSGDNNIGIGLQALRGSTVSTNNTGGGNVAIGESAMNGFTTATQNVAIGQNTLASITTGIGNVTLGSAAYISLTTGGGNIGMGTVAGYDTTVGSNNLALGLYALNTNVSGNGSTAVGTFAMRYANSSAGFASWQETYNTAIGSTALMGSPIPANNTGTGNTAMGSASLESNASGVNNTALGYGSGSSITTGGNNLTVGAGVASTTLTTGASNILIGTSNAVTTPTSGTSNWLNIGNTVYGDTSTKQIAIGSGIAAVTSGIVFDLGSNTNSMRLPVGTTAQRPTGAAGMLRYNTTTADTGVEYYDGSAWQSLGAGGGGDINGLSDAVTDYATTFNMFLGSGSGAAITTGQYNVALGYNAMLATTTGHSNIAFGFRTLLNNTSGDSNIAIGFRALEANTTGGGNIAIGRQAGYQLDTAGGNVVVGNAALASSISTYNNTAIGTSALYNTTQGDNTAVGASALNNLTTGGQNVGIGSGVGSTTLTTGWNNILIGTSSAVTTPAAGTNNWINIGNQLVSDWSNTGSETIGLNRNTTGVAGTTALIVGSGASNGNGALLTAAGVWTNASDRRIKEDIQPLGYALDTVMRLKPVAYKMKDTHLPQIGFIAQDVETVLPEVVVRPTNMDDPTQHYTMSYGNMVAVAVKAIQELKAENDNLRQQVAALQQANKSVPVAPAQASGAAEPPTGWLLLLAGGGIVLLLGLGGVGMMVLRLRRDVRALRKVA